MLKRLLRSWLSGPALPWLGAYVTGGARPALSVSTDSALSLPAVWRACGMYADLLYTQPVQLVERSGGGQRIVVNGEVSRILALWEQRDRELSGFSAALLGNGYTEIVRKDGKPVGLVAIAPQRVTPEVEEGSGRIWYRVARDPETGESERLLPEANVIHFRYRSIGGRHTGTPPIVACSPAFAVALQARDVQRSIFENISAPSVILTAPGKVSQEVATRLKTDWEDNFSRRSGNLGRAAVLGDGLEAKTLSIVNAVDAALTEQVQLGVADVARCYSIPPVLLAQADGATAYASAVEASRVFAQFGARPWLQRVGAELSRKLLTDDERARGIAVEFDVSALLRSPGKDEAEYLARLVSNGIITSDEARAELGYGSITGGDKLRVATATGVVA